MKIIITIDQKKFEDEREAENIIATMHDELLQHVDEETNVDYKYDDDKDASTYSDDLASDFIDDEDMRENLDVSTLQEDYGIIKKIKKELENDAMGNSGRSHLSGSFAQVTEIVGVRYKAGNKWVIRIFAHVETGIADEQGKAKEEWNTQSLWTDEGKFIELFE